MTMRTVKGPVFAIVVDQKRIVIQHVGGKGKRCRVSMPPGVRIEEIASQTSVPPSDCVRTLPRKQAETHAAAAVVSDTSGNQA